MARQNENEIPVKSRQNLLGEEAMEAMTRPMERPLWMPFGSSSPPKTDKHPMMMMKDNTMMNKKKRDFNPQDMLTMD